MFTLVQCPACGGDWAESDVKCPACGFEDAAEDVVASWVSEAKHGTPPPSGNEAICLTCGYEGPLIEAPDGDRALCPACGTPWQDAGGILRRVACKDCGRVILLTEQHREKIVICPGCHSLLGCLLGRERRGAGRRKGQGLGERTSLFDLMTVISAAVLNVSILLELSRESDVALLVQGSWVMALSGCWAITVLRMIAPGLRRGRRFSQPGTAACLAVTVGSFLNLLTSWDTIVTYVGPRSLTLMAMLRAVTPTSLSAAVGAVWILLVLDGRWRSEPSWIDRTGRCLGVFWLLTGLAVPFVRYFL